MRTAAGLVFRGIIPVYVPAAARDVTVNNNKVNPVNKVFGFIVSLLGEFGFRERDAKGTGRP